MVATQFRFLDLEHWKSRTEELKKKYATDKPFPHIVIEDFTRAEELTKAEQSFPSIEDEGWIHYLHFNEKKHGLNKIDMIPNECRELIHELNSPEFIAWLSELTGIPNLIADESMEGGGLHQSKKGGFLNIHADFTVHPHKRNWQRRVNVLVYLNKDWKPEYKGDLELWTRDMKQCEVKVSPVFNRCVIFNTDFDSYHGLPEPIECPDNMTRKSIALYYFTEEKSMPKKVNTNYQPRPDETTGKKLMVWLDKQVLWTYSRVKSMLGLNDDFASKILNKFGGGKKKKK
jgi:Rps23 Pro-64 3,4-dihydroxylase Tpa1-like proline 4-hydroxylase